MLKKIRECVDFVLFLVLFILLRIFTNIYSRLAKSKVSTDHRILLALVPEATIDALEQKGVLWMLYDRDLNGYFDHVYLYYYPSNQTRTFSLTGRITVIERKAFLRGFKSISYLFLLFHALHLVRTKNVNLIQAQHPYFLGVVNTFLTKLTKIPSIVSIHADYDVRYAARNTYYTFFSHTFDKYCERYVFSNVSYVFPIRKSLGVFAAENGASHTKIRIIPHGISPDIYLRVKDSNFHIKYTTNNRRVITFVGRLAKDNFINDIFEVIKKLVQTRTDFLVFLIGGGVEQDSLEQITKDLEINSWVRFLGWKSKEEVAYFRINSDVNLVPLGGFSLIEAAMSSTPVVTYDVEWHSELIEHHRNGCIVAHRDTDAMTQAICFLLDNPDIATRYGLAARKDALEKHSIDVTNQIKIRYYEEIVHSITN